MFDENQRFAELLSNDIVSQDFDSFLKDFRDMLLYDDANGCNFAISEFIMKMSKQYPSFFSHLSTEIEPLTPKDGIAFFIFGICDIYSTEPNFEKSLDYLTKSSELCYASATHSLSYLYQEGIGVPKNAQEANRLLNIAADQGLSLSMYNLSLIDHSRNLELLNRAANSGNGYAMFALSEKLKYVNHTNSYELLFKASLRGHEIASIKLWKYISIGFGVKRDVKKAVEMLGMFVNDGRISNPVEYAIFLIQGLFVEKNESLAITLFQKTMQKYFLFSNFWYALCLIEGRGTNKNVQLGLEMMNRNNSLLGSIYASMLKMTLKVK